MRAGKIRKDMLRTTYRYSNQTYETLKQTIKNLYDDIMMSTIRLDNSNLPMYDLRFWANREALETFRTNLRNPTYLFRKFIEVIATSHITGKFSLHERAKRAEKDRKHPTQLQTT